MAGIIPHPQPSATAPASTGPGPPVRVVELLGTPGSGKTALLEALREGLRAQGYTPYTVVEAARPFAERTILGRLLTRIVPATRRPAALWETYLVHRWLAALRFALEHPRLLAYLLQSQRKRPPAAQVTARRIRYWFLRLTGSYRFLRSRIRPGEVLLLDEGFVHRVVQLHASEAEHPAYGQIDRYLRLVPRPDLTVHIRAPLPECVQRVRSRGVWERYRASDPGRLEDFITSAHRAVRLAASTIEREGWPFRMVENSGDLTDAVARAADLADRVGPVPDLLDTTDQWANPLYTVCLPKPGRLRQTVSARLRSPAVDSSTAGEVLEHFGLALSGGVANLPMGWRNRNVVVDTDEGRKVLRQYPDRWTADAVAFEHSLLGRLAEIDYSAPRLVPTPHRATLVEAAGSRWALFDLVEGDNLAACALRPSEQARLAQLAGCLLARFHLDLEGFVPEGRHHLGFEGTEGERSRDLSWLLGVLDHLPADTRGTGPAARLRNSAPRLGERLSRLSATLSGAPLTRTVIHGDFGLHNLLFRRDGTATVHDFELARLDWRLIDLVRMLSRQPPDPARALITAYRATTRLPPEEWRLLPEVWEFYRLSGAVRSWHTAVEMGDPRRLGTAWARIEEADWIAHHRLTPWETW